MNNNNNYLEKTEYVEVDEEHKTLKTCCHCKQINKQKKTFKTGTKQKLDR